MIRQPSVRGEREHRRPRAGHRRRHAPPRGGCPTVGTWPATPAPGSAGAAGPRSRPAAAPARGVSACTASADRPAANAASTCGTWFRQQAAGGLGGRLLGRHQQDRPQVGVWFQAHRVVVVNRSRHAITRPPYRLAAALSAWPSSSAAHLECQSVSGRMPGQREPGRHPGHDRGRDEPSPRACGTALSQLRASPVGWKPSRSVAARSAHTTRWVSSVGTVSAP